jgi:hypothetical protein
VVAEVTRPILSIGSEFLIALGRSALWLQWVAKLLRLQSLDQFKGMDWFRDQFKLEALSMTSQQYV